MTIEGWRDAVLMAAHDPELLELMAQLLTEQDAAKNALCQAGFGVTGTPWPHVVAEVLSAMEHR